MTRPHPPLRIMLSAGVLLLLLGGCANGSDAVADATEVVTERVVVTETETVFTAPPDDGGETGDDQAGDGGTDERDGDGDDGTNGDDDPDDGDGAAQPFPANTEPDEATASGGQLALTEVRVGTHDGFDRVTLEFDGEGEPGWFVTYTDDPRAQGSGRPVDVAGAAVLQALIRSVALPVGDNAYDGPERIDAPRLQVIDEVVLGTTFEGNLGAFVGTTAEVPFRARRFADPPRVVIDVVHPDAAS